MTIHSRAYRFRRRMLRAMTSWVPWGVIMATFQEWREYGLTAASLSSESFHFSLLIYVTFGTAGGLLLDHFYRPLGATIESP